MAGNDLLPGNRYRGPLDEFAAHDALPRAIRRALDNACFPWSSADCFERLNGGETVGGLLDLIRQADQRASRQGQSKRRN